MEGYHAEDIKQNKRKINQVKEVEDCGFQDFFFLAFTK